MFVAKDIPINIHLVSLPKKFNELGRGDKSTDIDLMFSLRAVFLAFNNLIWSGLTKFAGTPNQWTSDVSLNYRARSRLFSECFLC